MDEQAKLLAAIDLLYGAVLKEKELPRALSAITEFVNAKGVYHLSVNRTTGVSTRNESVGIDPAAETEYQNYFLPVTFGFRLLLLFLLAISSLNIQY